MIFLPCCLFMMGVAAAGFAVAQFESDGCSNVRNVIIGLVACVLFAAGADIAIEYRPFAKAVAVECAK